MAKPNSSSPPMTIDAHVDIPWQFYKQGPFDLTIDNKGEKSMVDFPRMKLGGLDAAIFALYLSDAVQDRLGTAGSADAIGKQWQEVTCQLNKDSPKIMFALEGGRLINDSLQQLEEYRHIYDIKYLTVTHNFNTSWADSATDISRHDGLTEFGREVVRECERLGIIMDVSHGSDYTCEDILDTSMEPVIASHSGCRAILDHPRNLPDYLIKEIAAWGGVIHVPFARRFIGPDWIDIHDHINHIVDMVGVGCVGIGSDLDGAAMVDGVGGVEDWSCVLMDELADNGYSDDEVVLITGGNTMRVLEGA